MNFSMDFSVNVLSEQIEYLNFYEHPFCIKSTPDGDITYLYDVEVDKRGYLTCYMAHIDDYYYVSDKITCLPSSKPYSWLNYLYYKNNDGEWVLFKTLLQDICDVSDMCDVCDSE